MADLQEEEHLFTTDTRSIIALVYVRTLLSKMVPIHASFKGKEASQETLWRVVQASWKAPQSTRFSHVTTSPSLYQSQAYLMSTQYIGDRRRSVLGVIAALSELLPSIPQQEARNALCNLVRCALRQAVEERAILLQREAGLGGVAIRIDDKNTKIPLCPNSTWMSLPPHEWKFHLHCLIYCLGLKQMAAFSQRRPRTGKQPALSRRCYTRSWTA